MAKITKACKGVSYPKPSNVSRKLKSGGSLGMKSVKAGYDKNPGVTRADIIVAGKGQAKKGMKIKKAQGGDKFKKNPQFEMALEKSKSDTIKLNPPAPRKGGKLVIPKPYKKGGKMTKKCAYGCK